MPADAKIAAGFLEDALKLSPDYAAAHAFLAWCHEICFMRGGYDEPEKIAALRHARTAIAVELTTRRLSQSPPLLWPG
jgi:adenylate cyclase